jgi:hypothetical protein
MFELGITVSFYSASLCSKLDFRTQMYVQPLTTSQYENLNQGGRSRS